MRLLKHLYYAAFRARYSYPCKAEIRAIYAAYGRSAYATSAVIKSPLIKEYKSAMVMGDLDEIALRRQVPIEHVRQILWRFYWDARRAKLKY